MTDDSQNNSIFDLCAPVAKTTTETQPRVYSPSQRGPGITGKKKRQLACIIESHSDEQDNYQGETLYPVSAELQRYPIIARQLRNIEFRPFIKPGGETALAYRKMPFPGGKNNLWIESAASATNDSIERWGQITSDHTENRYLFEAMLSHPEVPDEFPKLRDLFVELLSDFVIDSVDHSVILRLAKHESGNTSDQYGGANFGSDQEDNDSAY